MRRLMLAISFAVSVTLQSNAFAQTNSLFGTQNQAGGGGATVGGSGAGIAQQPNAGVQQDFGQASGTSIQDLGGAAANVGQQSFTGANTGGGFVGNRQAGDQGGQATRQINRGGGGGGFNNNATQNQQTRKIVRPRARIAFKYSKPQMAEIRGQVQSRVLRIILRRDELRGVEMAMDDKGHV
ncbi:MAG: hypothetical protein O3A00_18075, partial [Planctomycetota bacterium]|nr:hypothetical protein [Planctomycetota bacterium]